MNQIIPALTLKEWFAVLFEKGDFNSPEFKSVLSVFGKERLADEYKLWKAAKKNCHNANLDGQQK